MGFSPIWAAGLCHYFASLVAALLFKVTGASSSLVHPGKSESIVGTVAWGWQCCWVADIKIGCLQYQARGSWAVAAS